MGAGLHLENLPIKGPGAKIGLKKKFLRGGGGREGDAFSNFNTQ